MKSQKATLRQEEQFLGEIETQIAGMQYQEGQVEPGEHINLEREKTNEHDRKAISVENGRFQPIGYVPKKISTWLSPLVDAGKVRIDGYVPKVLTNEQQEPPLALMIFLAKKGQKLLQPAKPESKQSVMHNVVLRAYQEAHGLNDPRLILELAEGLQPLAGQELLPETHLLLALIPGIAREIRAAHSMQTVADFRKQMDSVQIGSALRLCGLSIFPLSWANPGPSPYMLLSKAIENGTATVAEVSESGSVPHLRLLNKALRPLLIIEGEILVGAKQNRVVNLTTLVAAKSTLNLPVSCVEHGRWHYRSRAFESQFCAPPTLRHKKLKSVHANRRRSGEVHSDQGEVWDEVRKSLGDNKVASQTESLCDGLDWSKQRIETERAELTLPEHAAGILVGRGDKIVGMDLFDSPETFSSFWPRLSEAYCFDALRDSRKVSATPVERVNAFLRSAIEQARPKLAALGLGEELEMSGDGVVGSALWHEGLCHMAAFSDIEETVY